MASKVPKHIALILDGNRRYAKKLGLQTWKGHEFGLRKLEKLFGWCIELGIKELTLYCLAPGIVFSKAFRLSSIFFTSCD